MTADDDQQLPIPPGLGKRGRAFWDKITGEYAPSPDEAEILTEVCRLLDQCDHLAAVVHRDGLMVEGSVGQQRLHPALPELRGCRIALGRLMAQLQLDGSELDSPGVAQRKAATASRWENTPRGATVSDAARRAASIRWKGKAGHSA
ncbi:hypothetical protein [Pseudonocardia charpentierae]|uniref:Phage terminase, small subunit, putative, P27 family n=1 Tax=Pseudonocardia charpentierae TaxID=3075545 RepID=A0ABU2NIK5_9PSEU|nr:hypothetical protein [Pseudonocardia sp. DSM 45834]MDT0353734.1 hypothetical protein [Pseudonocardia sp. DSM 45834]